MVFVPEGQGAGTFPASLTELTKVKSLGGSTGAWLMEDTEGRLFVTKKGASAGHIREEAAADAAYRALGLNVPECRLYETDEGPVKVTRFVEGKSLDQLMQSDKAAAGAAMAQLRQGFVADAILGNWDVVGLEFDNIIVGSGGRVWRIDNGGSLRYRAQGALKNKWGAAPTELWTMRQAQQAGTVFGSLTMADIFTQYKAVAGRKVAALKVLQPEVRKVVAQRFDNVGKLVKEYGALVAGGMLPSKAEAVIKQMAEAM
jgi:hypothetical protein